MVNIFHDRIQDTLVPLEGPSSVASAHRVIHDFVDAVERLRLQCEVFELDRKIYSRQDPNTPKEHMAYFLFHMPKLREAVFFDKSTGVELRLTELTGVVEALRQLDDPGRRNETLELVGDMIPNEEVF